MVRNTLRAHREAQGKSVRFVAKATGIDFGMLSRIERGLGTCGDETKVALAAELGTTVGELFFPDSDAVSVYAPAHEATHVI